MSKKIEVTVCRRTYSTYEVEVPDEFTTNGSEAVRALEDEWFEGGGWNWELVNVEVANWDIDYVGEIK